MYVQKTSLVWIFQQAEHVSTDCFFQVRKNHIQQALVNRAKIKVAMISVFMIYHRYAICAFKTFETAHGWRLKKVLQFANFHRKARKIQQYKGLSVNLGTDVGVLCSWFDRHPPMALCTFSLANPTT